MNDMDTAKPAQDHRDRIITAWLATASVTNVVILDMHTGPVDSAREGWFEAECHVEDCGWETAGHEPVVDDAAHDHADGSHPDRVRAERVMLEAARAYCEAAHQYPRSVYDDASGALRHLLADAQRTATETAFRAAITAAITANTADPEGAVRCLN